MMAMQRRMTNRACCNLEPAEITRITPIAARQGAEIQLKALAVLRFSKKTQTA